MNSRAVAAQALTRDPAVRKIKDLGTEAPHQEIESPAAEGCFERPAVTARSMKAAVERENLKTALAQVARNKGAAGVE